jgi:hypothetical protein
MKTTKPHIAKALMYEEKHQAYQIKQAFLKIQNNKRKQRKPVPLSVWGVLTIALLFLFV